MPWCRIWTAPQLVHSLDALPSNNAIRQSIDVLHELLVADMSLSLRCKRLVARELQDLAIRFRNIACSEFMCLMGKHRAWRCGKIRAPLRSDECAALLANFHENRMPPSLIGILYCQERCLSRCPSRGRRAANTEQRLLALHLGLAGECIHFPWLLTHWRATGWRFPWCWNIHRALKVCYAVMQPVSALLTLLTGQNVEAFASASFACGTDA